MFERYTIYLLSDRFLVLTIYMALTCLIIPKAHAQTSGYTKPSLLKK